jgi:hypothetical protein
MFPLSETGFHYRKLLSDNGNIQLSAIGNISQFDCLEAVAVSGIVTTAHTDRMCAILSDEAFGSRLIVFNFLLISIKAILPAKAPLIRLNDAVHRVT